MEAAARVTFDARVMASRDEIRFERTCALPKPIELDFTIAHDARIRRPPSKIFGDEMVDHPRVKVRAQIDDIEREVHSLRYPARVLEIVVRAAGAAPLRYRRLHLRRKPHRDADNVITLLAQHRGGDRTVHPAGHRDEHARGHRTASARGSAAATRRQTRGIISPARAISSAVVLHPRLSLSELRASSVLRPIASSTCDGSTAPAAHADPIETSTPSRSSAISMLSPSTPGNVRLSVLGIRPASGPLR